MDKAIGLGAPLNEETLTEITLFEIASAHQVSGEFMVEIATKSAENRHGADWEWWLIKNGRGVGFRVQAKRLFENGAYQSLFKSGPDRLSQAKTLISTAEADGLVPLYCFYNSPHTGGFAYFSPSKCRHDYKGPSLWG